MVGAIVSVVMVAVALATTPPTAAQTRGIALEPVVEGLSFPVGVIDAHDGTDRLFIIEQSGTIRILQNGSLLPNPYLDVSSKISFGGERGLLGLAFHPAFKRNRRLYVNYTDTTGDTVIAEYRQDPRSRNGTLASSERIVLTFDQPFANHNGGGLHFGPDRYLYIASGDGGSAGDPQGNGQRLDTLLGKILRIEPRFREGQREYTIPADNPFRNHPTARPEIWSYGLRNPWRFSFDRRTGAMWIADVGQDEWEEIDLESATAPGGTNWGWSVKEGSSCFIDSEECAAAQASGNFTDPIAEYSHDNGCSVTGGFVYRGAANPQLRGLYFFGDYCSGNIWTLNASGPFPQEEILRLDTNHRISSFGEDRKGELYITDHRGGSVQRIVATG